MGYSGAREESLQVLQGGELGPREMPEVLESYYTHTGMWILQENGMNEVKGLFGTLVDHIPAGPFH